MAKPVSFFIGIDIGKNGAVVVQSKSGNVDVHRMPLDEDGEFDYEEFCTLLMKYGRSNSRVLFEDIGSIYGVGKTSYGVLMKQAGAVEMACVALSIPYKKVRPRKWQEEMFKDIPEILQPGTKKRDTKAMALVAARDIFPSMNLNFGGRAKLPHDGLVDALLMSEYLMRGINGPC